MYKLYVRRGKVENMVDGRSALVVVRV